MPHFQLDGNDADIRKCHVYRQAHPNCQGTVVSAFSPHWRTIDLICIVMAGKKLPKSSIPWTFTQFDKILSNLPF